jgi:F-type H+-transporting ATPase subunit alpha
VRGNEPELLKKIAEGDWSDETQGQVEKAVERFADDFGFDLDEEGHPLDEGGDDDRSERRRDEASGDGQGEDDQEESESEKEEAGAPA